MMMMMMMMKLVRFIPFHRCRFSLILANKDDHITDWTGTTREASANPGSDGG